MAVTMRIRDSAATRARIESEALRLFAEKGFDATSIRDIAQGVGVADAALYRYFPSKDALGRELFLSRYAVLASDIAAIAGEAGSFDGKVLKLIDRLCRMFDDQRDVFTFILFHQHAHLRFVPETRQGNAVEALRELMAAAHAKGEIREADADLATAQALGVVLQPAMFVFYGRMKGPLANYAQAMAAAVLNVVRAG